MGARGEGQDAAAEEDGAAGADSITSEIDAYNEQCVGGAARVEEDVLVMVHNVVGTAKVVCSSLPFDLQLIHSILPNSTFKKKKFAAITIRLFDPHYTVLLFASGKMVLTGCRDFLLCVLATHKVIVVLRQAIPSADFECSSIQMQNIVGHVDMLPRAAQCSGDVDLRERARGDHRGQVSREHQRGVGGAAGEAAALCAGGGRGGGAQEAAGDVREVV